MKTIVIIIMFLFLMWVLMRPGAMRRSGQFMSMCPPGYMPTGSGCVTTGETIGSS
jgi:hypothetical protein